MRHIAWTVKKLKKDTGLPRKRIIWSEVFERWPSRPHKSHVEKWNDSFTAAFTTNDRGMYTRQTVFDKHLRSSVGRPGALFPCVAEERPIVWIKLQTRHRAVKDAAYRVPGIQPRRRRDGWSSRSAPLVINSDGRPKRSFPVDIGRAKHEHTYEPAADDMMNRFQVNDERYIPGGFRGCLQMRWRWNHHRPRIAAICLCLAIRMSVWERIGREEAGRGSELDQNERPLIELYLSAANIQSRT